MIWLILGFVLMSVLTILSVAGIVFRMWTENRKNIWLFLKLFGWKILISILIFFMPLYVLDYLYGSWIPLSYMVAIIPGAMMWIVLTLFMLLPFLNIIGRESIRSRYTPRTIRITSYSFAALVLFIYLFSILYFPQVFETNSGLDYVLIYTFALFLIFLYTYIYPRIVTMPYERIEKFIPKKRDYKILGSLLVLSLVLMIILGSTVAFFPEVYHNDIEDRVAWSAKYPGVVSPNEIRLVPWSVAQAYLERVYGDAAAYLDTSTSTLRKNTHPTIVRDEFVWLNVPEFEPWKWLGGRTLPFYVMVNATGKNIVAKRVDINMKVSTSNIEWDWRVSKIVKNKVGEGYCITQVRFDLDDNYHPYYIAYLTYLHPPFYYETLDKLVIIDAVSGQASVYTPKNAPSWLEVVYPDEYVYYWIDWWAHDRYGWYYANFIKSKLYDPDLPDAKFLLINGTPYWYIPLRQMQSHVLGGYILVNTRTGKPVFYDRANENYVDYNTAWIQLHTYLSSGEMGYMQLSIREGYLYPISLGNNTIKEVYILPLYAGLTLQKVAIIDPVNYQNKPVIADDVESAIEMFRRGESESQKGTTVIVGVDGMYIEATTAYLYHNHTIITINKDSLKYGNRSAEDDWIALQIAYSRYLHGSNVTLKLYMLGDVVVDIYLVDT